MKQMYELARKVAVFRPQDLEEYTKVEEKLKDFSERLGIDIKALDLVLWSMRTGKVFK